MSYGDKIEELERIEDLLSEESLDQLLMLVSAAGELPADIEQEIEDKIQEFFKRYKDYNFDAVVVMMSDGTPIIIKPNSSVIKKIREMQEIELDSSKAVSYVGIIVGIYDNAEKALMQIAREPVMRVIIEGKYGYVIMRRLKEVEDIVVAASVYSEKPLQDEEEEEEISLPLGAYLAVFDELIEALNEPLKRRRSG